MHVNELLALCIEHNASDLHLSTGLAPLLRVDGELKQLDHPPLTALELNQSLQDIMNEEQRTSFAKDLEIDFAFALDKLARFRVNVFQQQRGPAAVFRVIPTTILSIQQLGLPKIISTLADKPSGLVLATLHTNSATKAINRIIDVFPAAEKAMIRTMLSESLNAVIAQSLLKKERGGRVAALEIMVCNAALKHMIREDKIAQMVSVLQTGREEGMFTLDQHLAELVQNQVVAAETARIYAVDKGKFV